MSTERPATLTFYPRWVNGELLPPQAADFNGRTLLVIDPNDREQVERLVRSFWNAQRPDHGGSSDFAYMQAALRSLIEPPKPDEPTGLGAVVEDAEGQTWVRTHNHWRREDLTGISWDDLSAVRVLSEGVQP